MSRATPEMRNLAKRLLAAQPGESIPAADAFDVCNQLRPHLSTLMGAAGFRALLLRALALARADLPKLSAVQVRADGSLEGMERLEAVLSAEELRECRVVLFAHLLGLLVAFIGANLTLGLMREVWPNLPPDKFVFDQGAKK